MKKILPIIAVAAAAYLAYPYWAANSLAEAIEEGDEAALRRSVDWQALRAGLKEDLAGMLSHEAGKAIASGDPGAVAGGVVASALGRMMLEPMIDALITPEGLAGMIREGGRVRADRSGARETERAAPPRGDERQGAAEELRERVSWAFFTGPTAFNMVLETDDGREVVAEMHLQGVRWRLVRLRFPEVS
jgi:hypothetical protein